MALAGTGAICIWNDIIADGRDEFYAWHLLEHIPERVAIPGFRRGRRYIACDAATSPEFFTLYETATPAVLTGADYLARLNAPTAWTKTATQGFRKTSRALTEVHASLGPGPGAHLAALRFGFNRDAERAALAVQSPVILAKIAAMPQITGAHLCLTDNSASAQKTTESRDRTDIMAAPDGVILIEGCNQAPVQRAATALAADLGPLAGAIIAIGHYRLEHLRDTSEAVTLQRPQ